MKLSNVGKVYGDTVALKDVTAEFGEGEITSVLGESGAGKTTLMGVLAGTLSHTGTVEGRRPASYLFQSPKLLPNLTAEGNLKFVLPKSLHDEIGKMLKEVGLGGKEKCLPRTLSGGERQRVAIARAFLYPHELLLMDEPFSSLDLALKRTLIELVGEMWKKRRQTIVFVTHDVHEAALLSHRAIVLKRGELVLDTRVEGDVPRDFFSRPPVEDALVSALMGDMTT